MWTYKTIIRDHERNLQYIKTRIWSSYQRFYRIKWLIIIGKIPFRSSSWWILWCLEKVKRIWGINSIKRLFHIINNGAWRRK